MLHLAALVQIGSQFNKRLVLGRQIVQNTLSVLRCRVVAALQGERLVGLLYASSISTVIFC